MSHILPSPPIRFRLIIEGEVSGIPQPAVPQWLASKISLPLDLIGVKVRIDTAVVGPADPKLVDPN